MSQPSKKAYRRYDQSPKGKYRRYRSSARQRGIEFGLTFEEFVGFWQKPCFYCGYKIRTVGIDRVDNTRGYTPDNSVSACAFCNQCKSNLTQAHFFDLCRQVVLTHKLV